MRNQVRPQKTIQESNSDLNIPTRKVVLLNTASYQSAGDGQLWAVRNWSSSKYCTHETYFFVCVRERGRRRNGVGQSAGCLGPGSWGPR